MASCRTSLRLSCRHVSRLKKLELRCHVLKVLAIEFCVGHFGYGSGGPSDECNLEVVYRLDDKSDSCSDVM